MAGEPNEDACGLEDTFGVGLRSTSATAPEPEAIKRIGSYRLLQLIGEGGMGEVWLAQQLEPIRRKVAIKVIKAGMDTKQVVARFESERQALALMDHPAIAKVLDGGSTPEGRPYFVMEYVAGVPITEHCDTHKLSTGERLKLLAEVCEGVQHAHQKAIIHRDLKPSNILISLVDGKAKPKIIDFGIAKATGYQLTEKTLFTEVGAVIGTPEYMSPEQADLTGQDVDTRTDVYSLGVILYQLLTGELPFGTKELRSSSYDELRRKLKEVEPPKPSTKLSTLGEGAAEAARNRDTDPGTLRRQLEGDLDAVTMKALEKERDRRYGTPSELAADLGRHVRNEPVVARPASGAYRFRQYVRRHRGLVAGVGAVVIVLFAGVVSTTMGLVMARRARVEEARQRALAEARFRTAQSYAEKLFVDIAPRIAELPGATGVRETLNKVGADFVRELAVGSGDDPALRWLAARMNLSLARLEGSVYIGSGLGDYAVALVSARHAQELLHSLPPDYPKPEARLSQEFWTEELLAMVLDRLGQRDESLKHLERMKDIAAAAGATTPGPELSQLAATRLGNMLARMGRYPEARAIWEAQLQRLGAEAADETTASPEQLHSRHIVHGALAYVLFQEDRSQAAVDHARLALKFERMALQAAPGIVRYARDVAEQCVYTGMMLVRGGHISEGGDLVDEGLTRLRVMAQQDPANGLVREKYLQLLEYVGEASFKEGQVTTLRRNDRRTLLRRALQAWSRCNEVTAAAGRPGTSVGTPATPLCGIEHLSVARAALARLEAHSAD